METTVTPAAIDSFLNSLYEDGRSDNTVRAYSRDMRMFLAWTIEHKLTVSKENFGGTAARWLNEFRQTKSPKTTNCRLTSLRAFGRWWGIEKPLERYSPPTPAPTVPHPIPEGIDGVRRMLERAKSPEHQALVALTGLAGLRVGEALTVDVSCFDLDAMDLTVRGKGDKTRVIPISDEVWLYVASAYVNAASKGSKVRIVRLSDRWARRYVKSLGKRVDLRREIRTHDLRATFATAAHDSTLDMRVVQELLGHASVDTTQIYTQVNRTKMREAVTFT